MTKKSLYQFYLDLIPNLLLDFIFYLPEKKIGKDLIEKVDFFKDYNVLNKIYIFDYYEGLVAYEKDRTKTNLFLKSGKLQQNLFNLIEKKANSQMQEFQFILDKYFELVECLFHASNWMNNNLAQTVGADDKITGLFNLQFLAFQKHLDDLKKDFYPNWETKPNLKFNTKNIIDSYLPDISKSYAPSSLNLDFDVIEKSTFNSGSQNREQTGKAPLKNKIEKGKTPPVTEVEAEKLLLRTIFRIPENILDS